MSVVRACERVVRSCAGFMSVGALAVVLVIALAASFLGARQGERRAADRRAAAGHDIARIVKALQAYRADVGSFPSTEEGLAALWFAPRGEPGWSGPYLHEPSLRDPWERKFVYRCPGEDGADFDLLSAGLDGLAGGAGEGDDVPYRHADPAMALHEAGNSP